MRQHLTNADRNVIRAEADNLSRFITTCLAYLDADNTETKVLHEAQQALMDLCAYEENFHNIKETPNG